MSMPMETGIRTGPHGDREIVLTRDFDAPRELVFAAWTDPAQVDLWWGPHGFRTVTREMEVRVGGRWRFDMHGPDGTVYGNRMVYEEIVAPERLVYLHGEDVDDDPTAFRVTVTFQDLGGRTRLTSRMVFPTAEQRDAGVQFGAVELGQQTMERLAEHLAQR
jgi:uncharacterized protein YndB with AHSA1/START domain